MLYDITLSLLRPVTALAYVRLAQESTHQKEMSLIFYLHKANAIQITFTNTEFKALTPNFIFWCTSEIWYQCVGRWMYLYVLVREHDYDCTAMCPLCMHVQRTELQIFLYSFLPDTDLILESSLLILVVQQGQLKDLPVCYHPLLGLHGQTLPYFLCGSEDQNSGPYALMSAEQVFLPFPQSCLVDFHTGTFATTFILTCFSSLFSVRLGCASGKMGLVIYKQQQQSVVAISQ